MNKTGEKSKREFIKGTGAAAGALAMAAMMGEPGGVSVHEINALTPTSEQLKAFSQLPDDGPVVMLNLLKFKPNGGAAEYAKYSAGVIPILKKLGGRVIFSGKAEFCFIGQANWDAIALVEYPRRKTLMQMVMSPEYQAIHHHREAGLEGQINYAIVQTGGLEE
jgi:uncharacterized protein (DUF1330 family)